ncbi:MAG: hypothetical protein HQK81_13890 [Desulfovibrionaceae bacterium]|nr:hypothetical protein [Desulfovibrionaceae bacterium]
MKTAAFFLAALLLIATAVAGQSPAGPDGDWRVTRFVLAPYPEMAASDAKDWVGKQALIAKNRIVFDGAVCKTEGFERKRIDPVKYFESFDTDPNLFAACGQEATLMRTQCEETPFSEFLWLGGDRLVVFWEGAFFVLTRD